MSFAPSARAGTPASPKKVVTVEGVTEYRLDNGLRLLLYPDPSAARLTVNMTVLVGARHEGYGEAGMAHLLEHMVFKGTPSVRDVHKALRDQGADYQGITEPDRTYYYETLTASDANLEFAIKLEADRLVNSYVKREDLASEMTVVRNEFERKENKTLAVLAERMRASAYGWHNYGKTTMGNRSDIERVPIDRLQAFYRKYYQPDNVVLIVTGRFDEDKALGFVAKYFGPLKRPARKLDATYTEEPAQDGERTVVLRRVGSVGAVGVAYHVPSSQHADYPAVAVLLGAMAVEPNGRLYQSLVKSKKAVSTGGVASQRHDPGLLEFYAQGDATQSLEEIRDSLIRVVEGVASTPLTEDEVQRIKRMFAGGFTATLADSKEMANELSEAAGRGDWRLFYLDRDRVAKVTAADVTRVAGRYLRRNNRTVGMFIPTREAERVAIPAAPSAAELVKDYRGAKAITGGEAFDPTPENLEKRVQRSVLPGGVKVALLPKKTRGETVTAQLRLHYGNEQSLKDYHTAANFLGALMLRGTKTHNRQQIVDEVNKLQAGIRVGGSPGELTLSLECRRENLPRLLRLVGEILREPAFPEAELSALKREQKQRLEQGRTDPQTLALNALNRKLRSYPKTDIRYQPTLNEQIARVDAVTAEQVRRLYTEQLGGQVGEFAAVGDFDPAATREVLAEILKDWKSAVVYKRIPVSARTDIPASREDIRTPDKANALFTAAHLLAMRSDHPEYLALQMADYIFGGSSGSRLFNRVRQKEGLSYGVESGLAASDHEALARFNLAAICNPQNIDKVERAITEELKRFVRDGVSEDELAAAKKALNEQLALSRAEDANLATMLLEDLPLGRTFARDGERDRKRDRLTVAEVNQAIRRHLAPERLVIIRAGDFKKE
ncbi:MAG TPA: pitrilysin family protein [Gemmataceae bacterium]|nr:pitrilysin family protein [Gemmataceae bacterium]